MTTIVCKDPTVVLQKTNAVRLILDHAQKVELPAPARVVIDAKDLLLGFSTLADLTEWAIWMEACITDRTVLHGMAVLHQAEGLALDEPITVACVTAHGGDL